MIQELTPTEKQQVVNDLIGDWMDELNMFLLAKEGEVVYWSSVTGDVADLKWHRWTIAEVSRIAKVVVVPPQYMDYCTSNSIYSAAQERGRAYIEGIRSRKRLTSMYFNYLEHEGELYNPYFHTIKTAVEWFKSQRCNPTWVTLKTPIKAAWVALGMEEISDTEMNQYITEVAKDCRYKVCKDKTRYTYNGGKYTCLKLPNLVGVTHELSVEIAEQVTQLIVEKHNGRNRISKSKSIP